MADLYVSSQELRNIITGKTSYRKCPSCQGEGIEYWVERDRKSINSVSVQEYTDTLENRTEGLGDVFKWSSECENCNGVGFISIAD